MLTFTYCSKGQGEAYILNCKTNAHGFTSIGNLSLVSSGGTILHRHITITSLLPLLPIVPCREIHKQSSL